MQQATLPDSDPPPVLSVGAEGGRHLRVRDWRLAALVVVVIGLVALAWVMR